MIITDKHIVDKYKELAQKTNLNGFLRTLFSPVDSVEECDNLLQQAEVVRQEILAIQKDLIKAFSQNETTKVLPIRLIRDSKSAAKTPYLRWRNYAKEMHGNKGFYSLIETMPKDDNAIEELLQVEKIRSNLNMQLGIIHNVMNQLKNMRESLVLVENFTP